MVSNPESEIPTYVFNDDSLPTVVGVSIAFLTIAWIVVALRVYVRVFLLKSFKLDDWTILGALVGLKHTPL